jgi:hypothetical protein
MRRLILLVSALSCGDELELDCDQPLPVSSSADSGAPAGCRSRRAQVSPAPINRCRPLRTTNTGRPRSRSPRNRYRRSPAPSRHGRRRMKPRRPTTTVRRPRLRESKESRHRNQTRRLRTAFHRSNYRRSGCYKRSEAVRAFHRTSAKDQTWCGSPVPVSNTLRGMGFRRTTPFLLHSAGEQPSSRRAVMLSILVLRAARPRVRSREGLKQERAELLATTAIASACTTCGAPS